LDCIEFSVLIGCLLYSSAGLLIHVSTNEIFGPGRESSIIVSTFTIGFEADLVFFSSSDLTIDSAQFLESLDGLTSIQAFSWVQHCLSRNYELVDKSQKPFYLMYMIQKWLALVLDLVVTALAVLVVGIAVKRRNEISAGFTGVSLTQLISFTTYLKMMILFWAQMETSIGAVARTKDFSRDTDKETQVEGDHKPPPDWPQAGRVEIDHLFATYK
jgi:ATP-binding cassette subfamily C (CFTR/MRP) protein 1